MSQHSYPLNQPVPAGHPQRITDADESRSADMHSRTVKYTISMSVRMACFIAAFFVHGWIQVVMLILAVILPYFAVVVANASGADLAKRTETNYYDGGPTEPAMLAGAAADGTKDEAPQDPTAKDESNTDDPTEGSEGTTTGPFDPASGSTSPQEDAEPDLLSGHWYVPDEAEEPQQEERVHHHHGHRHRPGSEREHG